VTGTLVHLLVHWGTWAGAIGLGIVDMRGVPSSLASRSRAPFHAFEARIAPVRGRSTGPEQRAPGWRAVRRARALSPASPELAALDGALEAGQGPLDIGPFVVGRADSE
jgi:hypothetical protein